VDSNGWVRLYITGTAYGIAGAPTDALLDETRQFLAKLATEHNGTDSNHQMISLVLARVIIEFYGGELLVAPSDKANPGFVIRLPQAA
jgi:hypothetical protein